MMLSEGQMSDFKGAALMLPAMPKARELLADKGYDADWFRAALAKRGVAACIPSKSNRKVAIPHDALLYKQRHKIENMFGRLKDWRRIHTRYDRCAHTYFSAICLAAAVLFWLSSMGPEPRSEDPRSYRSTERKKCLSLRYMAAEVWRLSSQYPPPNCLQVLQMRRPP
jgi:transposase